MTSEDRTPPATPTRVAVVGGGIGGLYAAYRLGLAGCSVTVLEQGDRWGGRIETVHLPARDGDAFVAEFGPMRFEPELQQELLRLAQHLEIEFVPFSPTTAPVSPTQYDQTDVEASFERSSHLLMWAVLRMFHGAPDESEVSVALAAATGDDAGRRGPAEFAVLRARIDAAFDNPDYEAVQAYLDTLRREGRLHADPNGPLLHDLGLWNALAETISPGALARIRDTGTFYHFIEHNPNAAEWGIFWLRQASTAGARLMTFAPSSGNGVETLVDRLLAKLTALPSVKLELGAAVRGLAGRPDGTLDVAIEGASPLNVEHAVLALPQAPLRRFAAAFTPQLQADVESVLPLPLLKAFLVVDHPWWSPHAEAQSLAWLVPTRELHYFTHPGPSPDCPAAADPEAVCACPVEAGMVMLYTDHPFIEFWRPLLPEGPGFNAVTHVAGDASEDDPRLDALRRSLVRQLLVEANPDVIAKINAQRTRVEEGLVEALGRLGEELVRRGREPGQTLAGVIAAHLRACSPAEHDILEDLFSDLFGADHSWVPRLLRGPADVLTERLEDALADVRSFGIHDWSHEAFGGAAYCWKPGVDSTEVRARLRAFPLEGSTTPNVHVCGEAYSDFQGFIEGALRSANHAVAAITGGDPVTFPASS
ncbi:MAG: FAD-dependent oxidoreductase [Dehalococcoidia bacterium]